MTCLPRRPVPARDAASFERLDLRVGLLAIVERLKVYGRGGGVPLLKTVLIAARLLKVLEPGPLCPMR